jgi:hypothetical protein
MTDTQLLQRVDELDSLLTEKGAKIDFLTKYLFLSKTTG